MRFSLPDSEEVLLLTPRWGDAGDPFLLWGMLAGLLFVAGLIVWLFRWEAKLIRRSAACALLTLRISVVGVLAIVACFEPRLVNEYTETSPGRVLVALDVSGSMSLRDDMTPLEQLRLVRALRLHEKDKNISEAVVTSWVRHLERGGDVSSLPWLLEEEGSVRGVARDDLARTRQAAWTRLRTEVSSLDRLTIARRLLGDASTNLLGKLERDHKVEVLFFSDATWATLPEEVRDQSKGSDLHLPLAEGLRSQNDGKTPLLGVVLLSDGRHNLGEGPVPFSARLGRLKVPVFAIPLGSEQRHPDVALLSAKAPPSSLRGMEFSVQVQVQASRVPAQDLFVEVYRKGEKKPLTEPKRIVHREGEKDTKPMVHSVDVPLKIDEIGTHSLEVKVKLSTPGLKEAVLENNVHPAVVRVVQQKPRILLVDGEARWEYHYLATFLNRDPNLELERVLFHQPRLDLQPDEKLKKLGFASRKLPVLREDKVADDPLFAFDCILLGDVSPEDLPVKDQQRLHHYVSERGGTLVMLSGKRFLPMAYAEKFDFPLSSLLPVTDLRVEMPDKKGFAIELSEPGNATPWLALHDDPAQNLKTWSELPPHFWGVTGKAKPGAVILAHAGLKEAKTKSEKGGDLIVQHNVGLGRVLWLGIESTWRFRRWTGDTHHHRFWGQLVLWAATKDLLPAGDQFIRYGSRQPVYGPDQPADLAIQLGGKIDLMGLKGKIGMKLFRIEADKVEPLGDVTLVASEGQPRLYQGKVSELKAGRYRVEPSLPGLEKEVKEAIGKKTGDPTFAVLPTLSKEMLDPSPDHDLLRSLARESGGKVIHPAAIDDLVEALERRVERKEHRLEKRLWSDEPYVWWLFGLISSFLTLEWLGRKWAGLP